MKSTGKTSLKHSMENMIEIMKSTDFSTNSSQDAWCWRSEVEEGFDTRPL
jgi:hypothetical protein